MFLIERLPKESDKISPVQPTGKYPIVSHFPQHYTDIFADKLTALEMEAARNIGLQLNSAWTPQYCKKNGITKYGNVLAVQASIHGFLPQRLNIPHVTKSTVPQGMKQHFFNSIQVAKYLAIRLIVQVEVPD